MTVAELIEDVLRCLHRDFYRDRTLDFFRDKHALTRAIARYGVECHSRGWEFSTSSIRLDLLRLLGRLVFSSREGGRVRDQAGLLRFGGDLRPALQLMLAKRIARITVR